MYFKETIYNMLQYDILNPDHERAHNKSVEIVLPSELRQSTRFSIKSLRWGMFRWEIYRMLYFRCFRLDAYSSLFNTALSTDENRSTGFALLTRFVEFNYIIWSWTRQFIASLFLALVIIAISLISFPLFKYETSPQ